MGWSNKFHVGSDMNQILGELLESYEDIIPKFIYNIFSPCIIKLDKEFPYAISESNKLTAGDEIFMEYFRLLVEVKGIKI